MRLAYRPLLAALLLALTAPAVRAQVLFSEDFDGVPGPTAGGPGTYAFPAGWALVNVDGRAPSASVSYVNEAWERREDFSFSVADSAMFSTSWYASTGAADDWAITPAIVLPATGAVTAGWNAVTYDTEYRDGYEVYVSTGAATVAACQANPVLFSVAAENTTWTARSASLAAYAGQTVRLCFRNNSFDKFLLLIDDVVVERPASYDAALTSVLPPSAYRQVPRVPTPEPLALGGTVQNVGTGALTNVRLEARVFRDGVLEHTATSAGQPLAASAGAAIVLPAYAPPVVAAGAAPRVYHVAYRALVAEADDTPANDTLTSRTVALTDSTLARDSGTYTGTLGIGAGNGGTLGQTFTTAGPGALRAVRAVMSPPAGYAADTVYAVLYATGAAPPAPPRAWNASAPAAPGGAGLAFGGAPEAGTAPVRRRSAPEPAPAAAFTTTAPQAAAPSTFVARSRPLAHPGADGTRRSFQFVFDPPVSVPAGTFFVGIEEGDSTLVLATDNTAFTPATAYVNWPTSPFGTWAPVENFGGSFNVAFAIQPLFDPEGQLPVELVGFGATADGAGRLRLRWATASETNNAGFHVEHRGPSAPAWQPLAFVDGHGTTAERHAYGHDVAGLAAGRHAFRLRQVDLDGTTHVSPTVEVTVAAAGTLALAAPRPHPVRTRGDLTLSVGPAQHVTVDVFDVLGRLVATLLDGAAVEAGGTRALVLDAGTLPPGSYVVRARSERASVTQPVIVRR